ncbi:MAG: PQQ-binding-like beta-propeller repeat protein, partial [Akkermansiaceae bacterium]|nr:PQQ-binding-like beta-propeller repeat protein [Akkermansiaceae bacterium]
MSFVAVLATVSMLIGLAGAPQPGLAADFDAEEFFVRTCQGCHNPNPAPRAHTRAALEAMPPERILKAMVGGGLMGAFAIILSDPERRALAEHLSSRSWSEAATPVASRFPACSAGTPLGSAALDGPHWSGWGIDLDNTRFQPAEHAGLSREDLGKLELRWALGFDGSTTVGTQPAVVADRLFVGSPEGKLYGLDAKTGCLHWQIVTDGPIRGTPTVTRDAEGKGLLVHVGDREGYLYAVDPETGEVLWKVRVDEHPDAVITGSPVTYKGRVYAVVASLEELTAAAPDYECCTFRGSVVVHDAFTGELVWKSYIIDEEPKPTRKTEKGVQLRGPSGAGVWGAPTIDPARGVLYVTTGDSYSQPAAPTSDAVVAYDLETGALKWTKQTTIGDAYTAACLLEDTDPQTLEECGPDIDYGASAILRKNAAGEAVLLAGQKSGVLHALDPDDGRLLWKNRLSPGGILGGIEWGFA